MWHVDESGTTENKLEDVKEGKKGLIVSCLCSIPSVTITLLLFLLVEKIT